MLQMNNNSVHCAPRAQTPRRGQAEKLQLRGNDQSERGIAAPAYRFGEGLPASSLWRWFFRARWVLSGCRPLCRDLGDRTRRAREESPYPLHRGRSETATPPGVTRARPRRGPAGPEFSSRFRTRSGQSPMAAAAALGDPPQVNARSPGLHRPHPTRH